MAKGGFRNDAVAGNTAAHHSKQRDATIADTVKKGNQARARVASQKADSKKRARNRLDKI